MTDRSEIIGSIRDMLHRSDVDDRIALEIDNAIDYYNRQPWYFTEVRNATFSTVAGQEWYSSVDATAGNSIGTSSDYTSSINVNNIIEIDYMKVDEGGGVFTPLNPVRFETFELWRDGTTSQGEPDIYVLHLGQIGLFPIPTGVQTINVSGVMKAIKPANNTEESVYFNEARELIENGVMWRVLARHLEEEKRAVTFRALEKDQMEQLAKEYVYKRGTGKIKAHSL